VNDVILFESYITFILTYVSNLVVRKFENKNENKTQQYELDRTEIWQ
jgi:hypothetical protein